MLAVDMCLQDAQLFQQLTAGPPPPPPAAAAPPGKVRRATVTTAVGGAGLALGAGVVKLVHFVSSRLQRQRRKAKRRCVLRGGGVEEWVGRQGWDIRGGGGETPLCVEVVWGGGGGGGVSGGGGGGGDKRGEKVVRGLPC